jgi:folate-binding protein YgfZ
MSHETPLSEQHEKLGATLGNYFGFVLPERFGDSAAEYRQGRESVALIDTNYHAIIGFEGPDRIRYLNAMLTNNLQALAPGQGAMALLLNPQGHILAELECYAEPDKVLALSHALVHERTVGTLDKFIIMDDVTLVDSTADRGTVAVEGPQAATVVKQLCGVDLTTMAELDHAETTIGPVASRLIRRTHFGETGAEFLVDREHLERLWASLLEVSREHAGGPMGYAALNALRLEAGIPWFGYDFDDTVIPHEAGLETTHVSFTKGCYTGQEIVERVRSRGHVNRRRTSLQFSGSVPPEKGTKLLAENKEVGHVTSAAFSPAAGRPIGMGYVRREHSAVGSQLNYSSGTAEVIELPSGANRAASSGERR